MGAAFMRLKKPEEIKQLLAKKYGWLTHDDIAVGTRVSRNTISKALRGESIRQKTVKALAEALEREPMSIAEFVN
jgi:transcriptional regulator with XRE-family HTH domain